jgi:hypothetical protein
MKEWIKEALRRTIFRRVTLTDILEQEMTSATAEARQAEYTILTHQYMLHMATARIKALEEWNHRNDHLKMKEAT